MKKEEKCLAALNWKTFDGYVHVTIVFASVSSMTTYIKETFKLYYCCTCICLNMQDVHVCIFIKCTAILRVC